MTTLEYVESMTVAEFVKVIGTDDLAAVPTLKWLSHAINRAVAILDAEPAKRPRRHAREIKR